MEWWQTLLIATAPAVVTALALLGQQALTMRENARIRHDERLERRLAALQDERRAAFLEFSSLIFEASRRYARLNRFCRNAPPGATVREAFNGREVPEPTGMLKESLAVTRLQMSASQSVHDAARKVWFALSRIADAASAPDEHLAADTAELINSMLDQARELHALARADLVIPEMPQSIDGSGGTR